MSEKQHSEHKGWRWPTLTRAERITLLAAASCGASTALVEAFVGFVAEVMRAACG